MGWSNAGWLSDDGGWYLNKATGGGGGSNLAFIGSNSSVTAGASFTFTSQAIGVASANRIVVLAITHGVTGGLNIPTVTIGGISAALATGSNVNSGGGMYTELWYAAVPTGTTANIVITLSGSEGRLAIGVYTITSATSAFSAANGSGSASASTLSTTVTVPSGGYAIAVLGVHLSSAAGTVTNGGNLPIDSNGIAFGNSIIGLGSSSAASGSTAFTFNWTGASDGSMSVATFTA